MTTVQGKFEQARRRQRRQARLNTFLGIAIYALVGAFIYALLVGIPDPADPWLYFYLLLWWIPVLWYAFLYVMTILAIIGIVVLIWKFACR